MEEFQDILKEIGSLLNIDEDDCTL